MSQIKSLSSSNRTVLSAVVPFQPASWKSVADSATAIVLRYSSEAYSPGSINVRLVINVSAHLMMDAL